MSSPPKFIPAAAIPSENAPPSELEANAAPPPKMGLPPPPVEMALPAEPKMRRDARRSSTPTNTKELLKGVAKADVFVPPTETRATILSSLSKGVAAGTEDLLASSAAFGIANNTTPEQLAAAFNKFVRIPNSRPSNSPPVVGLAGKASRESSLATSSEISKPSREPSSVSSDEEVKLSREPSPATPPSETKPSEHPLVKATIAELATASNDVASFDAKANEAFMLALVLFKESNYGGFDAKEALRLIDVVISLDKYRVNDVYLFRLITTNPQLKEYVHKELVLFFNESIAKSPPGEILRGDEGLQRVFGVMQNGYLGTLYQHIDKKADSIREQKLHDPTAEPLLVKVKKIRTEVKECLKLVSEHVSDIPVELRRLYKAIYNAVVAKTGKLSLAEMHVVQILFLRGLNPRFTRQHLSHPYASPSAEELFKVRQCIAVTKVIQSALALLESAKIEKDKESAERLMFTPEKKGGKTLNDFLVSHECKTALGNCIGSLMAVL